LLVLLYYPRLALLRAGRFDWQVLVDRPDRKGCVQILKVHVGKVQLAPELDLDSIAALTTGFTGADLANLVNEAAIIATRRNGAHVTLGDFTAAIERMVAGLEKKSRVLNQEERRRVAFHEMGNALVASSLPGVDPVQKVSIIPRGVGALGYTIQRPTEDCFLLAQTDLENRIAVLMGGRAAEKLVFAGSVSTGAADDLQRATEIAIEMVAKHGTDETPAHRGAARATHAPGGDAMRAVCRGAGASTYAPPQHPFLPGAPGERVLAAEATAREIDLAVREIIARAFDRATAVLERRREDKLASNCCSREKPSPPTDSPPCVRWRAQEAKTPKRLAPQR
jgi:cell division protease FtsH